MDPLVPKSPGRKRACRFACVGRHQGAFDEVGRGAGWLSLLSSYAAAAFIAPSPTIVAPSPEPPARCFPRCLGHPNPVKPTGDRLAHCAGERNSIFLLPGSSELCWFYLVGTAGFRRGHRVMVRS